MPLIPPALDDRSYDDLVQEMLASVPAHTPEWTNPQPGDPGRTLIELFAWLADTILYRANLIPEKQRIAFLRLVGQKLQPAAAATGLLSLSLDPAATKAYSIVAPAMVAGAVSFETLTEIDLQPITAQGYMKLPLSEKEKRKQHKLLAGMQALYGLSALPSGYKSTPIFLNNAADPTGLDLSTSTDQSLWLALLAGKPESRAAATLAMGAEQVLNIGFSPLLATPALYAVPGAYDADGTPAPVKAAWSMSQNQDGKSIDYTALKIVADTTAGLTQPGVVRLRLPQATLIGAPSNDVTTDPQAGVGTKPPRIADPAIAARLVAWVRLQVTSQLQVGWLGINAVEIDQRTTLKSILLGVSDGSSNQHLALPGQQVDPTTFQLEVDMPGLGFVLWPQTDDLAVLQGPVAAYVLDPEAGTVKFGNGLQGAIPPAGRRIRARQMRSGGGVQGNLPAGSLTSIQAFGANGAQVAQTISVLQPLATSGGGDAETFADAEQRIPSLLRHQDRAVTASDYSDLARQIPGAGVARVEVLPLFKPQTRTKDVPGVVSVMVLPGKASTQYPCPRADRPMLETVYKYLSPRTPATAEMYVIATEYKAVSVSVAVEVKAGFGLLEVSQAVETALRGYLWPLAPGGPAATGWPLGRHVRNFELEVIVSQVPGVIQVNGLNLFTRPERKIWQLATKDSTGREGVRLHSWVLPEVHLVDVLAGADGSGVEPASSLTPPVLTDDSLAVPVVPNVC